jgi:hypothetical protein
MALPNSGKRELILAGSEHNTFTDLPRIVDALALSGSLPPKRQICRGQLTERKL